MFYSSAILLFSYLCSQGCKIPPTNIYICLFIFSGNAACFENIFYENVCFYIWKELHNKMKVEGCFEIRTKIFSTKFM